MSRGAQVRAQVGDQLVREVGAMFQTIGLQLGYRYEDLPICVPDGTPPLPDRPDEIAALARPGARAPHVWLRDHRSILDLFGRGFTLLRFGKNAPDGSRLVEFAALRVCPL